MDQSSVQMSSTVNLSSSTDSPNPTQEQTQSTPLPAPSPPSPPPQPIDPFKCPARLIAFRSFLLFLLLATIVTTLVSIKAFDLNLYLTTLTDEILLAVFIPGWIFGCLRVKYPPMSRLQPWKKTFWGLGLFTLVSTCWNIYEVMLDDDRRNLVTCDTFLMILILMEFWWTLQLFERVEASQAALNGEEEDVEDVDGLGGSLKLMEEGLKSDQRRLRSAIELIEVQQKQIQDLLRVEILPMKT